jgi:hypothetical protein
MSVWSVGLVISALLVWVCIVYLTMSFGVRRGQMVWGGRYPGRLAPDLRWRGFGYAALLLVAAWVIAAAAGVVENTIVTRNWLRALGWAMMVFLGVSGLYSLFRGTRWERLVFAPITLSAALFAGWLTFG